MKIIRNQSPVAGTKGTSPTDACYRDFENECRRRGIRVTPQRMAVYRALAGDTSHPTADVLYARLRPAMSWLSLATVYRTLDSLEKEGLVRRVSTTGAVARYDANLRPHQHLVCRICGTIIDFENARLSSIALPELKSRDFLAEDLEIRVLGVCGSCRPGRAARADPKH